jgi:hypothetical protein
MKTISRLIFSVSAVLVAMVFSAVCHGHTEQVDLPCCVGTSCPTRYVSGGMPGVQQSAVVSEMIKIGDKVVPREGAPGHDEWKQGIVSSMKKGEMPREEARKLLGASRGLVRVYANCSGFFDLVDIGKIGSSIICPFDAGIEFEQNNPTCKDPQTGPHSVVEITKVSREENEREIKELQQKLEDLRAHREALEEEHRGNQVVIGEYDQMLVESADRLFGTTGGVLGKSLMESLMVLGGISNGGFMGSTLSY